MLRELDEFMARLHDRMPVILEPKAWDAWLADDVAPDDLQALIRPAADGVLASYPVSKAVGNVKNNSPELIEAVRVAD